MNTTPKDQIFKLCSGKGQCWTVIIYAFIVTFLTIGGILLNFSVIFVTIRTKSFRGTVNILFAFYSLCEIVHLSGNFLSIFSAFSGQYFMPYKTLISFAFAPIICGTCAVILLLFTGIERLFAVLFPFKKINQKRFLAIVLVFNIIQIIILTLIYSHCEDTRLNSLEVFANYYEVAFLFYTSQCSTSGLFEATMVIVCSMVIYALIAVTLHCRKDQNNSNSAQFNNRIFRSLFTIVAVNIGGYLILSLSLIIIKSTNTEKNNLFVLHTFQICGILMHISAASNGPILYLTSSEYRDAFQKEFSFLFKLICKCSSASVSPHH
ncbi:hypothetical protein niasHT_023967 [Heterodera trifolii]|uniref:G-protein coupled receptors family 1 profile domain-containing protein n=1 Tax=Heterodera trifolii TaxID=157864 RepID=A0ABD2JVN2_9BILA